MKTNISNTFVSIVTLMFVTACSSSHTLDKRVNEANYQHVNVSLGDDVTTSEPIRILKGSQQSLFYNESTETTPLTVSDDQMHVLVYRVVALTARLVLVF